MRESNVGSLFYCILAENSANMEDLIGKKVFGFRFDNCTSGLIHYDFMDPQIGKLGTIISTNGYQIAIKFKDGYCWWYPLDKSYIIHPDNIKIGDKVKHDGEWYDVTSITDADNLVVSGKDCSVGIILLKSVTDIAKLKNTPFGKVFVNIMGVCIDNALEIIDGEPKLSEEYMPIVEATYNRSLWEDKDSPKIDLPEVEVFKKRNK